MTAQSVGKEPLLTPWQLSSMSEFAEFGAISPKEISKRHIRILTALYYLQSDCKDNETEYAGIQTIQTLIEYFFQKRHSITELLYWVQDLGNRGYIALLDKEEVVLEECLFGLTSLGKDLYTLTYEDNDGRKKFDSRVIEIELVP